MGKVQEVTILFVICVSSSCFKYLLDTFYISKLIQWQLQCNSWLAAAVLISGSCQHPGVVSGTIS